MRRLSTCLGCCIEQVYRGELEGCQGERVVGECLGGVSLDEGMLGEGILHLLHSSSFEHVLQN